MHRLALALVPLLAATTIAAAPQKRVAEKGPADFGALLTEAKEAWSADRYGTCLEKLREATSLVMARRIEAVLAALPEPEGYEVVPDESAEQLRANQMLGGLATAFGNVIERKYRGPTRLAVTVTADSPIVQMLSMTISNPALMDKDSERIEYEQHAAILKKTNNGAARELTIILSGKHVCQVSYGGADEDFLFAQFDQATVDALAAALDR